MNFDENNPDMPNSNNPELEARVVAWVAGEASAFEAAELERLCAENPELAVFKRRIEAVHGLVGEAMRPEPVPLRLSPERRAKLLQVIGGADATKPAEEQSPPTTPIPIETGRRNKIERWHVILSLAASFVLICGIGILWVPSFQKVRSAESEKRVFAMDLSSAAAGNEEAALPEPPNISSSNAYYAPKAADRADFARLPEPSPSFGMAAAPSLEMPSLHGEATANDEGVGVLPPYEITAEHETGYTASSTLAGTRVQIRTEMRDVGSAVSVIPNQSSRADAFTYKSKAEPAAKGGESQENADAKDKAKELVDAAKLADFSYPPSPANEPTPAPALAITAAPGGGIGGAADDEVAVLSPFEVSAKKDRGYVASGTVTATRLRGLESSADKVSDFKQSEIPWGGFDSSVHTGTKPLLFGVGSPAGSAGAPAKPRVMSETAALQKVLGKQESDKPLSRPAPKVSAEDLTEEVATAKDPVSTFSLHVSDASFRLAQSELARGRGPDPERIRPEEFYNAFDYGDPAPVASEKISCRIEQAAHPFLQQRNLVRIAMKVPATGRGAGQPLRLTVLLDTSGSMERADRAASVRRAMQVLVSLLGPNDRLTLIGFARTPRLLAEELPGDKAGQTIDLIARTPAEGGTNFEEALKLAGELARRHQATTAQNRIVLLTDGAANLGNADPEKLATGIETLRQQGIAFDACGVGLDGIDDAMLEALTRKGDGRYSILDSPEAADAGFARQLAGAFRPAAQNVKVQVRFNPARVARYRLIGFEKHRLRTEDFRNDKVDAAELAAEEAAIALYQVEPLPQGEGELGEVYVRFRDTATGQMVERSWTMSYDPYARAFDRATPTLQLAGTAALLAEVLHGGKMAQAVNLDELAPVVNALRGRYAHEPRVQELVTMFEQMRRMERK